MLDLIKQTFTDFLDDKCTRIAAALSYYTAFSLAPMLTLAMAIGGLVLEPEDMKGKIEAQVESLVGDDGALQVKTMIEASEGGENAGDKQATGILATVISSVVLLVGLIGLVGQMQAAMNDVWEVKPDPEQSGWKRLIFSRLLSFGMLAAAAFILVVSLLLSTIVSAFGDWLGSTLPG